MVAVVLALVFVNMVELAKLSCLHQFQIKRGGQLSTVYMYEVIQTVADTNALHRLWEQI